MPGMERLEPIGEKYPLVNEDENGDSTLIFI